MPCGGGQRGRDAIVVASCDRMRQWSFLPALWVLLERLKECPPDDQRQTAAAKPLGPFAGGRASCQRRISRCTRRCQHLLSKERRKTKKKVGSAAESCGWRFQTPGWEPGQEGKLLQSFRFGQSCRSPPLLQVLWQVPKAVLRDAAMVEWNVVEVKMARWLILQEVENCWSSAEGLWCWFWDHHDQCGDSGSRACGSWESDLGGDVQESGPAEPDQDGAVSECSRRFRAVVPGQVDSGGAVSEGASAGGSRTSSPSWSCARRAESEAREVGAGASLCGRLDGQRVRAERVVQRAEAGSDCVDESSHSFDARLNDAFCTFRVESPSSPVQRANDALRENVPARCSHNSHNSFARSLHSLHGACGFVSSLGERRVTRRRDVWRQGGEQSRGVRELGTGLGDRWRRTGVGSPRLVRRHARRDAGGSHMHNPEWDKVG